ncbi:hypothetical protein H4684_003650 [Desulfomicrobium macestii]|uniref:Uncharacterized protein n=1 Tax=Desulfomicrobium macestii TaxID=90731 RepID=A0ABR9H8B1_9BACT|nr:hypothetical protein [Desulfomicrobium macestii]MBE1426966.1 hypothetical protein [Desulfomicrobium macestii]
MATTRHRLVDMVRAAWLTIPWFRLAGMGFHGDGVEDLFIAGRPKTAICCVSEIIQTAYVCSNTPRALDFFASLHLTIFERPANFEFFNSRIRDMVLSAFVHRAPRWLRRRFGRA